MITEPAPLAGTPPSASRFVPMLSGRRTRHRCCEQETCSQMEISTPLVNHKDLRSPTTCTPSSHGNRHEWVCGPTTSERSDWRRLAYPKMAVQEGEFRAHAYNKASQKPTRVGVRADDIGAKRLEEACIPRDGGFRGEVQKRVPQVGGLGGGRSKPTHPPLVLQRGAP